MHEGEVGRWRWKRIPALNLLPGSMSEVILARGEELVVGEGMDGGQSTSFVNVIKRQHARLLLQLLLISKPETLHVMQYAASSGLKHSVPYSLCICQLP
jgi:hypothetical protein